MWGEAGISGEAPVSELALGMAKSAAADFAVVDAFRSGRQAGALPVVLQLADDGLGVGARAFDLTDRIGHGPDHRMTSTAEALADAGQIVGAARRKPGVGADGDLGAAGPPADSHGVAGLREELVGDEFVDPIFFTT